MDLFDLALAWGSPAYIALQLVAGLTSRSGGWRLAALAPLVFAVPIAGWCLVALAQDSNLWPLPFIFFAPLGAAYLLLLLLLRAAARAIA